MNKFGIYLFAVLLLTLFSCAKSDLKLANYYTSYSPSFFEKVKQTLKYGKCTWSFGTQLTLNKDSTFEMETCANCITGQWYANSDTLFLRFQKASYKTDSLNYVKEWQEKCNVDGKTIYYLINGKYLEQGFKNEENPYTLSKLAQVTEF